MKRKELKMQNEKPDPPDYVVFSPVYGSEKGFLLENGVKRIRIGTARRIDNYGSGGIVVELEAYPMFNEIELWPYKEKKPRK